MLALSMEGVVAVVFVTPSKVAFYSLDTTTTRLPPPPATHILICAGNHIMEGVIKFGQISKTESERASERRGKANSGRPETEKKENRFNIIDRQAANVRWAAIQLEWR